MMSGENSATYTFPLNWTVNSYAYWLGTLNGIKGQNFNYNFDGSIRGHQEQGNIRVISGNNAASGGVQWYGYLNALYEGVYEFPGGAKFSNGVYTDETNVERNVNYGQIVDTPEELSSNVLNDTAWLNGLQNYSDPGTEGYTRALKVPSNFDDVTSYGDFVDVVPDSDLHPVPNDQPVNPNPDNPPGPPNPDVDFQEDLSERIGRLLAQPFNQLFPFLPHW